MVIIKKRFDKTRFVTKYISTETNIISFFIAKKYIKQACKKIYIANTNIRILEFCIVKFYQLQDYLNQCGGAGALNRAFV